MTEFFLNTAEGKIYKEKTDTADSTIWILNKDEFKALEGGYPYKKSLIQSFSSPRYCKAELYGGSIQGIMKIPYEKNEKSGFEFGFYMIKGKLIFIDETGKIQSIVEKINKNISKGFNINNILSSVFESVIENDLVALLKIEDRFSSAEEELLKYKEKNFYEKLISYRKRLSSLHSYYEQLINIGCLMQAESSRNGMAENAQLWQMYTNRAERLHNYVEVLKDYLLELRELYQYQNDLRLNKIMTFLTVVTTIFLPLTLIAGWYGMNFTNMIAIKSSLGYPIVAAVSLIIVVAEIIYFKNKKML